MVVVEDNKYLDQIANFIISGKHTGSRSSTIFLGSKSMPFARELEALLCRYWSYTPLLIGVGNGIGQVLTLIKAKQMTMDFFFPSKICECLAYELFSHIFPNLNLRAFLPRQISEC